MSGGVRMEMMEMMGVDVEAHVASSGYCDNRGWVVTRDDKKRQGIYTEWKCLSGFIVFLLCKNIHSSDTLTTILFLLAWPIGKKSKTNQFLESLGVFCLYFFPAHLDMI